MSPVKRICVFEHSVMTNFNCACPSIQRGQGSGFLSEGSSWLTACTSEQQRFWRDCAGLAWTFAARIGDKYQIRLTRSIYFFKDWVLYIFIQQFRLVLIRRFTILYMYIISTIWSVKNIGVHTLHNLVIAMLLQSVCTRKTALWQPSLFSSHPACRKSWNMEYQSFSAGFDQAFMFISEILMS